MKTPERIALFLEKYRIEKHKEDCPIAYMHTFSAHKEFLWWAKEKGLAGCKYINFVFIVKEMGFTLVNYHGVRMVIDKNKHHPCRYLIKYVPEIGKLDKNEPWPESASSFLMIK